MLNKARDNNIKVLIIIYDTAIDAAGFYIEPVLNIFFIFTLAINSSSIK
jgi:hypothetical protein